MNFSFYTFIVNPKIGFCKLYNFKAQFIFIEKMFHFLILSQDAMLDGNIFCCQNTFINLVCEKKTSRTLNLELFRKEFKIELN